MNHHNRNRLADAAVVYWSVGKKKELLSDRRLCVCNSGRSDIGYETAFDDGHLKRARERNTQWNSLKRDTQVFKGRKI